MAAGPWEELGLGTVIAWCALCAAANVLPVPATRHISLSIGAPVNVAIAYLFPPGLAAGIVLVSSTSEWELRRETTFAHALFNRVQLAASTSLASIILTRGPGRGEVPPIWLVVGAVVVYQASNWTFVAVAERTARATPLRRVVRGLLPSGPIAAATYLVLGFTGLVLALTSLRIGTWAVALVMLPLLGARHALNVSGQLQQAERERRALGDRLIDERERERVRIASDIHDVVLQQLAALQLDAESVAAAFEHGQPETAVRLAGQLRSGADAAIAELRGTIASLRRATIEDGLTASLERFARAFRVSSGIEVSVVSSGGADDLPLPVAILLFECCQEALVNAARHADASAIAVAVERGGEMVELRVSDDGVGLSPSPGEGPDDGSRSGLRLASEKVELSGGVLSVRGRPGEGTTVTVRVPLGRS
ncbi:MAG TPA: sensor histidine kinase [Acidimicrobiales bacterium]|nr:sensor histidine kinase [Acidimicrobiales bacterium]